MEHGHVRQNCEKAGVGLPILREDEVAAVSGRQAVVLAPRSGGRALSAGSVVTIPGVGVVADGLGRWSERTERMLMEMTQDRHTLVGADVSTTGHRQDVRG